MAYRLPMISTFVSGSLDITRAVMMPELKQRGGLRDRLDYWSLRAVPLTLKCRGTTAFTATGFFWRHEQKTFLITNWHVLSGRKTTNLQPVDDKFCAIPDEVTYPRFLDENNSNLRIEVSTLLHDEDGNVNWFEHTSYGRAVDIAAIEVPEFIRCDSSPHVNSYVNPVNVIGKNSVSSSNAMIPQAWQNRHFEVGCDVFIVGFPICRDYSGYFPIWKRGSIATELDVNVKDLPCFLIDTATRPGMSGSPVILYDLEFSMGEAVRRINYFMGVYSGRDIGDPEKAQLGIVWRTELILDVIMNGRTNFPQPEL